MSYTVDWGAFAEAQALLELKAPVELRVERLLNRIRPGATSFTERLGDEIFQHRIRIDPDVEGPEYASECIWHELAHNTQNEQLRPSEFQRRYKQDALDAGFELRSHGLVVPPGSSLTNDDYRRLPLEVEAQALAEVANSILPLCLPS